LFDVFSLTRQRTVCVTLAVIGCNSMSVWDVLLERGEVLGRDMVTVSVGDIVVTCVLGAPHIWLEKSRVNRR
jgi:hypothetical protein